MNSSAFEYGSPSEEALRLAQRIRLLTDNLRRFIRSARETDELTRTQEAVLSVLGRHGAMTTAQLAKRESLRPQSMGSVVAELLSANLVEKTPHPSDRRSELVSLTPAGRAAVTRNSVIRDHDLAGLFESRLTGSERAELERSLTLLESLTGSDRA